MSFQRLPRKRGEKVIFFFENLSLLPETRAPKEHFKLVFGSGNSDLAKIRPLKNWHSPDFLSGFALWNFASAGALKSALSLIGRVKNVLIYHRKYRSTYTIY